MRPPAVCRSRSAEETIEVLAAARMASEMTDGKFDITFGALADIWKFDHDQDNTIPDRASIEKRLPLVDYRAVQVNAAKATAFIARPACAFISAALAKATLSIARSGSSGTAASPIS